MKGYNVNPAASETVLAVGQLYFGDHNILPSAWLKNLRTAADRPYLSAALILSEIVYWYRPLTFRDEKTGQVQRRQRFKADKLHLDYDQVAERFGLSKKQVQRSLAYLETLGVVSRELRPVAAEHGQVKGNRVYVDLDVQKLKELSDHVDAIVQTDHVDKNVQTVTSEPSGQICPDIQIYHNTDSHLEDQAPEAPADFADGCPKPSKSPSKRRKDQDRSSEPKAKETPHQELMRLYQDALGYKIPNGGKEGQAAKKILAAGHSPADAVACYNWVKTSTFWKTKHLSLVTVFEQMGPWSQAGKPQTQGSKFPVSNAELSAEDAQALNAKAQAQLEALKNGG